MTDSLVLVRHGQTAANAEGRLLGRADVALTEAGREQVGAVATALAGLEITRVVSSPLGRAVQTAEALGHPVIIDDRWIEIDYGPLDQQPMGDVPARVWEQWRADPAYAPPGGESLAAVAKRVVEACGEIAADPRPGAVVVVSHVSPIKAAVAWALGVGPESSWRMFLDLASISTIGFRRGGYPVLETFNVRPWRANPS